VTTNTRHRHLRCGTPRRTLALGDALRPGRRASKA